MATRRRRKSCALLLLAGSARAFAPIGLATHTIRAATPYIYITLDLGRDDVLASPRRRRLAAALSFINWTEQGVPLVHPRAQPQQPAAEAREGVEHERDRRVVLAADLCDVY